MTQEEFNEMLQAAIAQGVGGGVYTSVYSGEEIDTLLGMTSYAAGSQVIENITTTVTDAQEAAEAAQAGAEQALADMTSALTPVFQFHGNITSSTDPDTLQTPGFWRFSTTQCPATLPITGTGGVIEYLSAKDAVNTALQRLTYSNGRAFLRWKTSAGWQAWRENALKSDVPSVDATLSVAGAAADAKATGDSIASVQSAIPAVDSTLSVQGAAADAKATGDAIASVSDAIPLDLTQTQSLSSAQKETARHNIEAVGYDILDLSILTGWSEPSRTFYRLNDTSAYLAQATVASGVNDWQYIVVPCSTGDVFTVTGTGSSNPRAWAFTDKDPTDPTNAILEVEGYGVSVVNKAVVAPEGAAYLIINRRTSLVTQESFSGITPPAADREIYSVLKSNNSAELWTPSVVAENTSRGITYSITGGVLSLSGTATDTFVLNMLNTNAGSDQPAAIPEWADLGGKYYIDPQKTGDDAAIIRVISYDAGGTATIIYGSDRPGFFTIPAINVHHIIVRAYVPNGEAVSCTMKPSIMSAPTNLDLYDFAARPMKIRVMQNNLGHFRWGFSTASPDTNGMSEAKYQEVLAKYKRLYGDTQPDILCVQEYVQFMDKALTHDAADVLYNPLYPVSSAVAASPKIFAAADVSNFLWLSFSATDTDQSTYTTRPVRGELASGARRIAVLTGALNPLGSWVVRESQLTQILEYLESYDYAIMAFDLNPQAAASGETRPEAVGQTASSELQYLLSVAASYGFTPANGGYWGTTCTYVRHINSSTPGAHYDPTADYPLDNILVKGDIKIRNFEVLSDWYEDLASDHVPVIADLYIY